jgi:hypothetical protein
MVAATRKAAHQLPSRDGRTGEQWPPAQWGILIQRAPLRIALDQMVARCGIRKRLEILEMGKNAGTACEVRTRRPEVSTS